MQRRGHSRVLGHAGRFRSPPLRTCWRLSAGRGQRSNEQSRSDKRNTSAPEETSGQMSGLHLSSANKHRFVGAPTCRRTSALAAQRKDDQILRTVVVRDSSPGGLWVHETRDDHCASEQYASVWAVTGSE